MFYFGVMTTIALAIPHALSAQTYPQDFNYSRFSYILLDAGEGWASNSIFHPLKTGEKFNSIDSDSISGAYNWIGRRLSSYSDAARSVENNSQNGLAGVVLVGLEARKQEGTAAKFKETAVATNVWAHFRFRNNWYSRTLIRATNEALSLPHFSGVSRQISRFGINSSEIDQSVVGYENDWATVEYGRTREIWGPMAEDNLVSAGSAPAWEEFKLEGRYKHLTYRYFCGFLESIYLPESDDNIQRYMVGRAIEYNNSRNLIISSTEVALFSGKNRPIDWAFLNPLAIELETEQNHRGNSRPNSSQANAVWVSHLDWLPVRSFRVAASILIDEFQFDQTDRRKGRVDLTGYLLHLAWTPVKSPLGITTYFDWVRIGTYTLMHKSPYLVFSTRGQFMGNSIGNDAEKIELGGRFVFQSPLIVELGFSAHRSGAMSLLKNPYGVYDNIEKLPFPSGQVAENRNIKLRLDYNPSRLLAIGVNGQFELWHKGQENKANLLMLEARLQIKPIVMAF